MSTMDKLSTATLPPCRVCEAQASGFHYGVYTCEPCKAFFRRSFSKCIDYECPESRSCPISFENRNSCAYCRYQKCIKMGMCKDACKTGRYSHEMKAANMREVKKAQNQILKKQITNFMNESVSDANACVNESRTTTNITGDNFENGDSGKAICDDGSDACDSSACESRSGSYFCVESIMQSLVDCNVSCTGQLANDKTELYEKTIQKLLEMHDICCSDDVPFDEALSELETECLEMIDLKQKIFGSLKPMSMDEYIGFHSETGIDIDGRLELMEASLLPNMEEVIQLLIAFAKTIPSFSELCLADQIGLLKASRLDYYLISRHSNFRPRYNLYSPCAGKVLHKEDMVKVKGDSVEPAFKIQHKIESLQLRKDETALISALTIMCPDNCDLQGRTTVEQGQEFLIECLLHLLNKHFPKEPLRFARIVECLTELRSVRDLSLPGEEELANKWWGVIKFPPLVYQLWTA